jgi:hypothetical protein
MAEIHNGFVYQRWTGEYTIPSKSTEVFSFWSVFVDPYHPHTYDDAHFNVSIAPEFDGENAAITPLMEVKRERSSSPFWNELGDFVGIQPFLFLTLQNDNDFPVTFLAAHVFIL